MWKCVRMDQIAWIQNWRFTRLCDTVSSRLCLWDMDPSGHMTSIQRRLNVDATRRRRCIIVMCPLGSSLPTPCQMSYSLPNTMFKETTTIDQMAWQIQFLRRAEMTGKLEPQHVKTYNRIFAPNENSNQPAYPRSLIRVFVLRMKKLCILGYPKCAQWRFWSDCAKAQADLNLRWAHMSEGTFSHITANLLFRSRQLKMG